MGGDGVWFHLGWSLEFGSLEVGLEFGVGWAGMDWDGLEFGVGMRLGWEGWFGFGWLIDRGCWLRLVELGC